MEFAIYDDSSGGNSRWAEAHPSVTVSAGLFNVVLGAGTPPVSIEDTVFSGANRWLEIVVAGDTIGPRARLISAPYAYRVSTVDGSYGGVISGDVSVQSDLFVSGKATIGSAHSNNGNGGFCAGTENSTSGSQPTVGGGNFNSALGNQAVVSGGFLNGAGDDYATVGGGRSNLAYLAGTVGGGRYNRARGAYSVVAGGGGLEAVDSNSVLGDYSSIGGGRRNAISGSEATIGGGNNNRANGDEATVGGGEDNQASAANATVGGGSDNVASGIESTISGGSHNVAYGYLSTVGGGYSNKCYGNYSVIPGGDRDTIATDAERSMAFGRSVFVADGYRVVFFNGSYDGRLGVNRDYHDGGINHPIHVGTDGTDGNGAHLTAGGVWTNGSSRSFKENFQTLDGADVLQRIDRLPMEVWEYRGTGERHIWPCAEDFHEQFDVGVITEDGTRDTEYLAAGDIAGVALAGVKELARENRELRGRIEQLESLVEALLAQQTGSGGNSDELAVNR
jgi:hypothetical protein